MTNFEAYAFKGEQIFLSDQTWENKKSFAATILSKQYICIQSVTDHAYLWLLYLKPVMMTLKKMKKEKLSIVQLKTNLFL